MPFSYGPLWEYIASRKITKKELANRTGLSTNTLARMRNGENINTSVLNRICNCLGCHIEEIMVHLPEQVATEKESEE